MTFTDLYICQEKKRGSGRGSKENSVDATKRLKDYIEKCGKGRLQPQETTETTR